MVRMSLMKRLHMNRDKCERLWEDKKICSTVRVELNRRMKKACECIALKSTSELYEDLSGIPCSHWLSAIRAEKLDMEDFVHSCYTIETYNKEWICGRRQDTYHPFSQTLAKRKKEGHQEQEEGGQMKTPLENAPMDEMMQDDDIPPLTQETQPDQALFGRVEKAKKKFISGLL
ncbi:hypothetical protein ACS0TY_007865 [Phlomoides rotata]